MRAFRELDKRRANLDALADLRQQPADMTRLRRRDLDHRLLGFDRYQRLVDDDVVALSHVPADDFGFLQTFAEIGEIERAHA
jgi:hypothetical protein